MSGELQRRGVGTLEAAYAGLAQVRAAHAAYVAKLSAERRRLDERSKYVLGSLEAARRFLEPAGSPAPSVEPAGSQVPSLEAAGARELAAPPEDLEDVLSLTRGSLDAARAELESWSEAEAAQLSEALAEAEAAVVDRVAAFRSHYRPRLRVEVARVGGERSIVHLDRPPQDDAVILAAILAGRPPTRRDYLEDDAVDQVEGPVLLTCSGPDLDARSVHAAGPDAEDAVVRDDDRRLLPVRAHVPVLLPGLDWPRLRLRARGPVLELESRAEGEAYHQVVPAPAAELFLGYLVSLRVRGALDVDIQVP